VLEAAYGFTIDAKFLFDETVGALLRRKVKVGVIKQVLFADWRLIFFIRVHIK